jgi:hypothetical protein
MSAIYNEQRSRTVHGSNNNVEPNFNNNFMEEVPRTKSNSMFDPDLVDGKTGKRGMLLRSERGKVLDTRADLMAANKKDLHDIVKHNNFQSCSLYQMQLMQEYNNGHYKLIMYIRGNEVLFVQDVDGDCLISQTYGSLKEAIQKHSEQKYGWVERVKREPKSI